VNIYTSGQYPFYYLTFVEDKNTHAYDRLHTDYNILGLPTVYFDGGYQLILGAPSTAEAESVYLACMDTCGVRPVPEIEVELLAAWSGEATMHIQALVQNNDTSVYEGHIRVYVAEIVSTRGWEDTRGYPYLFTFLDYALNEDILINPFDTWVESAIWKGDEHTDGYGNDFGDITQNNIMIIAAVFNAEPHLKYNLLPQWCPFYAHYLDRMTTEVWVNSPPFAPANPAPQNEGTGVEVETELSWSGGDPNLGDTVKYDVYFGETNPPPLVASKQPDTTFDPGVLLYLSTYHWQVIAWDNHDTSMAGPVWSFTTKPEWTYGDCNRDEEISISDVVYLINYLFKAGPAPDPVQAGDANCDSEITVSDVIYLVNYLFKGGQSPGC
jgi:hypothetical protein